MSIKHLAQVDGVKTWANIEGYDVYKNWIFNWDDTGLAVPDGATPDAYQLVIDEAIPAGDYFMHVWISGQSTLATDNFDGEISFYNTTADSTTIIGEFHFLGPTSPSGSQCLFRVVTVPIDLDDTCEFRVDVAHATDSVITYFAYKIQRIG